MSHTCKSCVSKQFPLASGAQASFIVHEEFVVGGVMLALELKLPETDVEVEALSFDDWRVVHGELGTLLDHWEKRMKGARS